MPYTFGAATSDYVSISPLNVCSQNQITMVAGWFYPTTLTAGRVLWCTNAGSQNVLEIDTTTSQLRWTTAGGTTRGVYTVSGDPITTNQWHFIALVTSRTASAESLVVWQATETTPPKPMTITTVTPTAGSFVALLTFVIGNLSATGTTAFQGDIGPMSIIAASNQNNTGPLVTTSAQTIDQASQDVIQRFVIEPCWRGQLDATQITGSTNQSNAYQVGFVDRTIRSVRRSAGASTMSTSFWTGTNLSPAASRQPCPDNQTFPFDYRLSLGAIR